MTFKGIDVSSIQGHIDWQSVKNAGYDFAVIKCYNGNANIDPLCITNLHGAQTVGLKTALYNVIYPLPADAAHPNRDPVSQAILHLSVSLSANNNKPIFTFADIEWPDPNDWPKWNVNAQFISDWIMQYLTTYSSHGGNVGCYIYPYYAKLLNLPQQITQYPLWIASYQATAAIPHPWTSYYMWQSSGGTHTLPNGVPVDIDETEDMSLLV